MQKALQGLYSENDFTKNWMNIFFHLMKTITVSFGLTKVLKEKNEMSKNSKNLVPEAREALNRFKMEAANEVGVTLNQGYNGDKTSRENGSVGGQMVKKMIHAYESSMK